MPSPIVILSALGAVSLEGSTLGAVAAGGIFGVAAANADFVLGAVVLVLCVVNAVVHAASDAGVYVIGHVIHDKTIRMGHEKTKGENKIRFPAQTISEINSGRLLS